MLKAIVNSPVRSGDQTIVNGDLVIGTSGEGVNFTANTPAAGMTSRLLNWYEEGVWTPTVQGSGTAGTYELNTGASYSSYTRIGRQVTLQSQIVLAAAVTGGGSGTLNIVGLPFTKGDSQNPVGAISLASVDMDNSARYATIRFASGGASSTLIVYQILDNANGISMPISAAVANAVFVFTLTYFV